MRWRWKALWARLYILKIRPMPAAIADETRILVLWCFRHLRRFPPLVKHTVREIMGSLPTRFGARTYVMNPHLRVKRGLVAIDRDGTIYFLAGYSRPRPQPLRLH